MCINVLHKGYVKYCKLRDAQNPHFNPQKCDVEYEFKNFSFPTRTEPLQSSKECNADKFCAYYNVCVKYPNKVEYYHNSSLNASSFGWVPYRSADKYQRKTFSWNFRIDLDKAPPKSYVWINGTSVWFDQVTIRASTINLSPTEH